jgi:DNA-binding MarR family transcriptional regulator
MKRTSQETRMTIQESEDKLLTGSWAFLTNHAHVLLCIARDPQVRARDIAEQIGITERAAQRILADLITDEYVTRTKVGRRNHYTINSDGHLRHPMLRDLSVGPLLDVLIPDGQPQPRPTMRPGRQP